MNTPSLSTASSVACPVRDTWSRFGLATFLVIIAVVSNLIHIPILFGVDFIFGSVISLIAVAWFGWQLGVIVAIAASAGTIQLWHHPYFVLISVCEAAFVAATLKRFWDNVLVAATLFWLVPGVLIFLLTYGMTLHFQPSNLLMLYLKQIINAIFNAMIASGILLAITLLHRPDTRIPLQQACFNTLVALVFVPALAILVVMSNSKIRTSQTNLLEATANQADNIVHYLELWRAENLSAVSSLAEIARQRHLRPSELLQREIQVTHAANFRFADMFIADKEATTVAFNPQFDKSGRSLVGLNFADRAYFEKVKAARQPVVSDVFVGRGGLDFPIVCFVSPILERKNDFAGFALGSIDIRELNKKLRILLAEESFKFTVSDTNGNVVTSSVDGVTPVAPVTNFYGQNVDVISTSAYRKIPVENRGAAYAVWQSMIMGSVKKVPSLNWTVRVEAPLGKFMADAESFYIEGFAQMLALTLASMSLSFLAVVWVSSPVKLLAQSTRDISRQPLATRTLRWPTTPFAEISDLVDNFKTMADSLRQRFIDLNREVQERKDAENRLQIAMEHAQAANVAKSAFLANMSHEIRTPLAAIIGYAELMEREPLKEQELRNCVDALLRNGRQLSQLVDDILDLSKIEAGHLKVIPEWISLDDLIIGGIEVLGHKARGKGLDLSVVGQGRFPTKVFVDPLRARQVLLNVVGNAIKFTDHGQIDVCLELHSTPNDHDKWQLKTTVTDTGPGINTSEQTAIFEPFVQSDSSYSRKHGGTGLGLSLSRTLTNVLGGDIKLVHSSPQKGSCFEITFTVGAGENQSWLESLSAARNAAKSSHSSQMSAKELQGRRILLVEDSSDNRALISRMLTRYGANISCATSGDEGIDMALSEPWDIVLMDMQMPGTDGHQATQYLRSQGFTKPIIALTAHALNNEHARSIESGCDAHVTKPVNWSHLVAVINDLCAKNLV